HATGSGGFSIHNKCKVSRCAGRPAYFERRRPQRNGPGQIGGEFPGIRENRRPGGAPWTRRNFPARRASPAIQLAGVTWGDSSDRRAQRTSSRASGGEISRQSELGYNRRVDFAFPEYSSHGVGNGCVQREAETRF